MRTGNSLSTRMLGVIHAPRATFESLAAHPRWGDVLVLTFLVTALSSAFLFETETGRLALLDQWERTRVTQSVTHDRLLIWAAGHMPWSGGWSQGDSNPDLLVAKVAQGGRLRALRPTLGALCAS